MVHSIPCLGFLSPNINRILLKVPLLPPNLLKNKIQLSQFEDLIGFIQQSMNLAASHLAASHLANRKCSEELYKMEEFCWQKGTGTRKKQLSLGNGRVL